MRAVWRQQVNMVLSNYYLSIATFGYLRYYMIKINLTFSIAQVPEVYFPALHYRFGPRAPNAEVMVMIRWLNTGKHLS